MLDHSELKARQNATDRQISNVKNFFENSNYPLRPAEMSFIKKDGDLIPLVPRVKPPLRRFIDRFDIASWWQLGASKVRDDGREALTVNEKD